MQNLYTEELNLLILEFFQYGIVLYKRYIDLKIETFDQTGMVNEQNKVKTDIAFNQWKKFIDETHSEIESVFKQIMNYEAGSRLSKELQRLVDPVEKVKFIQEEFNKKMNS